jgi:hypothetical protein
MMRGWRIHIRGDIGAPVVSPFPPSPSFSEKNSENEGYNNNHKRKRDSSGSVNNNKRSKNN